MLTKIIEATNRTSDNPSGMNWGKFMLGWFDDADWARRSRLPGASNKGVSVLGSIGHHHREIWVMDLQTCEGACFTPGGSAHADLEKHAIWVCPLFEPFLEWLYTQPCFAGPEALPDIIELPNAPSSMAGYRRPGPSRKETGHG